MNPVSLSRTQGVQPLAPAQGLLLGLNLERQAGKDLSVGFPFTPCPAYLH